MAITGDFFERIKAKEVFIEEIHNDFHQRCEELDASFHFNKGRAIEAYFHWMQDLKVIPVRDPVIKAPCHLKCAAFLIYWLRRFSPVDEFACDDLDSGSVQFLVKYGREYLAFDIGYRAAQVYERGINGRALPGDAFSLQSFDSRVDVNDFVETVTQVMKAKNVSPHALYLVLKAIFLRP